MNLLDRIDERLNDTRYRLQQSDFEDCAAALIGHDYPGLVAVTGGTDHGLDAELVKPNGQVLGLIITSSRRWDSVKKSLRGSLKSARDHKRRVDQIVVANLAEINRQKRIKLAAIAKEFECELLQVYDRPWFANALRDDPDWRRKVLHIEGGAFSLSRLPRGARPDEHQLPTVGRDDLLDRAEHSSQDLILWGVPGAGKSHVAGRLPGALFLERNTAPVRLLDDLLTANPKLVVVDDAGDRTDDIEHLLHARHAESLEFRVAVTCWPHEKESVADHLPDALALEVDLLTAEEIGTLLRERGITRTSVIVHLLQQAQGRPAWALNLADLLVQQGAWQAVWTGQALRDQIRAFLRRSKAPAEAVPLLATIALVSDANENQTRAIAKLFELTPTQFEELIRSVAIAGLVDVRRNRLWNSADGRTCENSYRVVPRTIAASIVADVYFAGHPSAVPIRDIKAAMPTLLPGILQTQIYAALLDAEEPLVPPAAEFLGVLPDLGFGSEGAELLRTYALISPECARVVFEYLKQAVQDAAEGDDEPTAGTASKVLAACVADSLQAEKTEHIAVFFASLTQLAARGWDYMTPIRTVIEDARDARTGDFPTSTAIVHLCEAMAGDRARDLPGYVWIKLACHVLQPTFDGNYMSPEKVNSLVMQSFTWLEEDIHAMYDALGPELVGRIASASNADLADLIELMRKWAHVSSGYPLPFGDAPNPGQRTAARRVAISIGKAVAPLVATAGMRAVFNREASSLDIKLDEPDQLFVALTAERDPSEDWEKERHIRDAELDRALAAYIDRPPSAIMTWLVDHDADLAMVKDGAAAWSIMNRLSMRPNPEVWLRAALDYGLGRSASPLISKCVDNGVVTVPLATELLADPGGRSSLIASVISECQDAEVATLVVDSLKVEDIQDLDSSYAIRRASGRTRQKMFTHPDAKVRSNAAALWAAEMTYSSEGMPADPEWASAMSDLVVSSGTVHGHMQSKALDMLAKTKPKTYMNLLVKHVEALAGFDDFDEWAESARYLRSAHRFELWNRVRESPMANNLFWVISAADVEWITTAVSDPTFPVSLRSLLHATRFQHGKRYPLEVLAVMLRPLQWQPDDLLWTLEVGTHWGEDHERLEGHLRVCRELAESPEHDLARLGERGVEAFRPRLAEARAAARRAAVRGTLNY
ncbi:hypothetical protein [Luteipulveratus flavus]|uniref:ATP-binding protein n=1 Tax=Luteipulveratus flavus TaxID=3031728 RepID=A0ABT6C1G8_9MICO|nr:hypothetical protein [Luteipulveratus sp. YIM 133296]MDF8262709.1 hypothetical protein [Luteipulveratus sp. YIM 133296]